MSNKCHYCGGECPGEPTDSEYLCDGFAGDIDDHYTKKEEDDDETSKVGNVRHTKGRRGSTRLD